MTTVEILRAARASITDARKWSRGPDATWGPMGIQDWDARCTLNTITHITCGLAWADAWESYEAVARAIGLGTDGEWVWEVANWNDDPARTHAEVLAAFDRAIAVEEAREQEFAVELGVGPYTRLRSLLDAPSEMAA